MAMKVEPDTNARHDFQIREQSGFFFFHFYGPNERFFSNLLNKFDLGSKVDSFFHSSDEKKNYRF